MTQTLLTVPPALAGFLNRGKDESPAWLRRLGDSGATQPYIDSDPAGKRLGSGGGTVQLLCQAWRATGRGTSFSSWLRCSPKLVLHAGGQSRRLPAYAALGKAFMPLPNLDGLKPALPDPVLADYQLPAYRLALREAGDKAAVLVTSGDVWLDFNALEIPEVCADIVGIGMTVTPEVAQHFGVYFVAKDGRSRTASERPIAFFRQKPSIAEILRETGSHDFFVDTGMWLLSGKAVEMLFRRCGWNPRTETFTTKDGLPLPLDLYTEVGTALGNPRTASPALRKAGLAGLTASVVPLRAARFYHLGSSRQLLESMEQLQWRSLAPQKTFRVAVQDGATAPLGRTLSWVEGAAVPATLNLAGSNLITGLPPGASVSRLATGQCLDIAPIQGGGYAVRPYGIDDTLRGRLEDATICGQPAVRWLAARGWRIEAEDIFQLPLYPVLAAEEITDALIDWFFADQPDTALGTPLFQARRLAAAEIPDVVDFARYFAQRRAGYESAMQRAFEAVLRQESEQIFEQDFAAIARFIGNTESPLKRWILRHAGSIREAAERPEHRARWLMLLSELASGEHRRLSLRRQGFQCLQEALVSANQQRKSAPYLALKEDQIVWARSPVRLDLAGGWTDTPPFCLEEGGTVLNVAVLLNGQPPIQAFVRPTPDPVVRLRSIDLGTTETVTDYAALADFRNPRGHFSLPKAALAMAGFLPEFAEDARHRTFKARLKAFGGGLEISLLSAVPKGSGLGTSSILGAAVLAALNRACGLGWDDVDLYNRVLAVEQLLTTGGGWQDQAGALFGSLKLIQTEPGMSQSPSVRYVPTHALQGRANRAHLLYYTGATRMAKGILQEIVKDMFMGDTRTRRTLEAIRANAWAAYHALQLGDHPAILRAIARSWQLNQELDPGTTTPEIEAIIRTCGADLAACKLLGAGGGGFMLMCAQDAEAGDRLRSKLESCPPNRRARFVDFAVSDRGLEVSVS
ncbi:hypothetical protein DB347_00990 [Opitutaceae bacterium EW11]|nr:hypothetical protein DB347_00990 [Opitutaceae bacterium EW11]